MALGVLVLALGVAAGMALWSVTHPRPPVPSYQRVTFRRGNVSSARFTADGQSVVYSARYVGEPSAKLYVQRLGTPDARPLELSGTVVGMSGGEMAILQRSTLSRMAIEGGTPRDLADSIAAADWSADGAKFVVVRRGADGLGQQLECPIGRVLYKAGGRSLIVYPRLSPAGSLVAYVVRTSFGWSGGNQLEVVDLAGRRRVVSKGWRYLAGLAWSPDGREVWFGGTRRGNRETLHAVTLAGKERELLSAPQGLRVLDVARSGQLLLTQMHGGTETRGRMAGDSVERDYSWLDGTIYPILTPDGRHMMFHEMGEVGASSRNYLTYVRRNDGKPPVKLSEGWGTDLSPDGRWALVGLVSDSTSDYAGRNDEFRLVPTGAGEARALARGPITEHYGGSFTPNGKRAIVGGAEAGKPRRLWIQELPDGVPRPFGPDSLVRGMFSPDGQRAMILESPNVGWREYPLDGGASRPLRFPWLGPDEAPYVWSSDSRWLYCFVIPGIPPGQFGYPLPLVVIRIDTRTGQRQPWLRLAPPDTAGVTLGWFNSLTPDGRYYAYCYNRSLSDLYLVTGLR